MYLDGLWSTWHKTLESQKPADLRLMSEKIWENTLKPVSRFLHRNTTPRDFCANITGAFLRWEVVGLIVTLVSLLAQSLKGTFVSRIHDSTTSCRLCAYLLAWITILTVPRRRPHILLPRRRTS
jgi:hypothetical protein